MEVKVKAIKRDEGTQEEREGAEKRREPQTAFKWKAWNVSFQGKQRANSKSWEVTRNWDCHGSRGNSKPWEGMSGDCDRCHGQSKQNLKFYYLQQSIRLKRCGGMEGTKSDFNIRNERKWGPGGKPWFYCFENLSEKGGGWQARESLWNKDVSIFVVESLQEREGKGQGTEDEWPLMQVGHREQ